MALSVTHARWRGAGGRGARAAYVHRGVRAQGGATAAETVGDLGQRGIGAIRAEELRAAADAGAGARLAGGGT